MLTRFATVLMTAALLVAPPALAGNVSVVNGQTTWQPTECKQPATPPSLTTGPETSANNVNLRVNDYNNYVQQSQAFMDCIANEAQRDAGAVSESIVNAAQSVIEQEKTKVTAMGAPLREHHTHPPVPQPMMPQ
jgi:hypothetical protein